MELKHFDCRFRLRLFAEDDSEIPDAQLVAEITGKVRLVVLEFWPSELVQDHMMVIFAYGNDMVNLEELLQRPCNPNHLGETFNKNQDMGFKPYMEIIGDSCSCYGFVAN